MTRLVLDNIQLVKRSRMNLNQQPQFEEEICYIFSKLLFLSFAVLLKSAQKNFALDKADFLILFAYLAQTNGPYGGDQ